MTTGEGAARLLADYSLEMTAKDVAKLEEAAPLIPPGTLISITFLPNEDYDQRVHAAATVRRLGFNPVPHISARRIKSHEELESFLRRLRAEADNDRFFVVAGDATPPEGPFEDALAVIRTGLLEDNGVRHFGISGYPEGHPEIATDRLWQALRDKMAYCDARGLDFTLITQFAFDVDPIVAWLDRVRAEGVAGRVRVGVSGPASVKTLLRYAARCGVGASTKVMKKYGMSIMNLLTTTGPDRFIEELGDRIDPRHGEVKLQFYPFGGFGKTAEWVRNYRARTGG